jgi:hypothetical protein
MGSWWSLSYWADEGQWTADMRDVIDLLCDGRRWDKLIMVDTEDRGGHFMYTMYQYITLYMWLDDICAYLLVNPVENICVLAVLLRC